MPSSAEYQDAIKWLERAEQSELQNGRATLALRCLRVVAAMEAGTVAFVAETNEPEAGENRFCANARRGFAGGGKTAYAPDPLTAAERAMGVGNG